ncbi:MAG: Flavodoxin, FldA [Promethearchaeota archaeon]|nr:MAG: Flavodoxin, FldA [Candidatus Lokiarchaeota archaeon]
MKSLIAYYTRTGNTRQIAQLIAKKLNSDLDEIVDTKKRSGIFGFLKAGYEATMKKTTQIKEINKKPGEYDFIILGTPNWNKRMTPALRTYILKFKDVFNQMAIFCSAGGRGVQNFLESVEQLCDKKAVAVMVILDEDDKELVETKIDKFIQEINESSH